MPFAIKLTNPTGVRYYSQTIESLDTENFKPLIILTDGQDPEEVDISKTLVEAERKVEKILPLTKETSFTNRVSSLQIKIVEYPEPDNDD